MSTPRFVSFVLICSFFFVAEAYSHGVRVFAWVEGESIQVEAAFRGGRPAGNAKITVKTGDGRILVRGLTDDHGLFRFPVPEEAKRAEIDLEIIADSGPGHRARWLLEASDYLKSPIISDSIPIDSGKKTEPGREEGHHPENEINEQTLRRIITEELDHKLDPIRRQLQKNRDRVGIRDITGGIGWILGLAGIAALIKIRKKEK